MLDLQALQVHDEAYNYLELIANVLVKQDSDGGGSLDIRPEGQFAYYTRAAHLVAKYGLEALRQRDEFNDLISKLDGYHARVKKRLSREVTDVQHISEIPLQLIALSFRAYNIKKNAELV